MKSITTILTALLLIVATAAPSFGALRVATVARLKGQERTVIRGFGLVMGLNGTGDSPQQFGPTGRSLLAMLEASGHPGGSLKEMGLAKNIALVEVMATIPETGGRGGDLLDCTVSAVSAKSLAGGVLAIAVLMHPVPQDPSTAETMALAWGPITIENQVALNVGKVKQGARLTSDFMNPYVKDGNVTLVLSKQYASSAMALNVATAINANPLATGSTLATAINQQNVVVKLPPQYFSNPMSFVGELMSVEITRELEAPPTVHINERAGIISIDPRVEIDPVAISHGNIVAEMRPLPAGQVEQTPQRVVGLDLQERRTGEANPRLTALVDALNAIKVPTKDIIEIIKLLERQGAIQGHVLYE
ncbi:MAG: flagellar basal body P-ring protein FlgI [Thermoguttaceae bacterium]